ncbi:MAG: hypothetical protein DHS80DRAFT_21398 [Piptocephalis tieghemiana]|nr:MAG: hypothetical protein DHS80DRAFT_21398 [Piptocephalis tieghemiana]
MRPSTHHLTLPYVLLYLILQLTSTSSTPIPADHGPTTALPPAVPASSGSSTSSPNNHKAGNTNTAPVSHTPQPGLSREATFSPTPNTNSTGPTTTSSSVSSSGKTSTQSSISSLPDSSSSSKSQAKGIPDQTDGKVQAAKAGGGFSPNYDESLLHRTSPASTKIASVPSSGLILSLLVPGLTLLL